MWSNDALLVIRWFLVVVLDHSWIVNVNKVLENKKDIDWSRPTSFIGVGREIHLEDVKRQALMLTHRLLA